ncbi:hypothetical protein M8J75_009179 [Diaphorina citri]|nr:hypothetical protein M8J75_009179 [Diaphorina citri]
MNNVLIWMVCVTGRWKWTASYSIDNFVRPFLGQMYDDRAYEDKHIYSTSTRHYGVTWVELVDDHTFTFHPPPSTMEISFPTLSDPEWMNQSCQIEKSQELFRQYQIFRRKFTMPNNLIPQTTADVQYQCEVDMDSGSMRDDIRNYLNRRYTFTRSTQVTPAIIYHLDTETTTKRRRRRKTTTAKTKPTKKLKAPGDNEDDAQTPDDETEAETEAYEDYRDEKEKELDEMDNIQHLSALDTDELLKEEKKMKVEKERAKKNVHIVLRDYDETNKTGLKYKHKEYMKKGYYFKDESAQFIRGSKEYVPKIVSNHSNLNRFIEKLQQQPPGEKGVKTGYKYRKERFRDSGYEFRDEAGKFYRQNIQNPGDVKDYDVGFRFRDTIVNNSVGKMRAVHRLREGVKFKKGFGDTKDYETKLKHSYEDYGDSRSVNKRKHEEHRIEKNVGRRAQSHIHYEVRNEQRGAPNGTRMNIHHADYDKIEFGHKLKKHRPPGRQALYIPREVAGGRFDYVNQDVEERDTNQSYVLRQQRGKVKFLTNGSWVWLSKPGEGRGQGEAKFLTNGSWVWLSKPGEGRGQGFNQSEPLPAVLPDSDQYVNDVDDIGAQFNVNETGFNLKDEMFENPTLNYKYNRSLGRYYSKVGANGSYKDMVYKRLDTRYKNPDGYRKVDRKGHVILKEKLYNISQENKQAYNLIHEKIVQPNFKMQNEKGFIQDMKNNEDYYEKTFTHYFKQYKSHNIKYTQQYNQIVNMNKQVINNTKLNISYHNLMKKSHDRVLYRTHNETWSVPWPEQVHFTMAPEMNYVPLLGTMEPQQDFLDSEPSEASPTKLYLLGQKLHNSSWSAGYTYEDDGHWIYPDSAELTTVASLSSGEIASIFQSFNGTRENRELNYRDWESYEITEYPKTTHICQLKFNAEENRMEFCKHPSHALTCRECNKTFKGWFEYNLHQQAVNRKLKKYFLEPDGLFKDMITVQYFNGSLRPGVGQAVHIERVTPNLSDPYTTPNMGFIPFDEFNPLHINPEDVPHSPSVEETPPAEASDDDLYDSLRESKEITRPDFKFQYRRNDSVASEVAYNNYSDEMESSVFDSGHVTVMKLAHAHLYRDIVYDDGSSESKRTHPRTAVTTTPILAEELALYKPIKGLINITSKPLSV